MNKVLQNIRLAVASLLLAGGMVLAYVGPTSTVNAQAKEAVCAGVNQASAQGGCSGNGGELTTVVAAVIRILSIIVGIAAVIMIIVGGLKYVTSGGDSTKIASAKNTIIYSIIGLIVVALAQFIVQFVLEKSTTGTQ